ncbi:hypothetical protein CcaverHIS002_0704870 [Cutaneotrichosporon cavernicola]|nr:hypothetical protein CcaverHIS002_0704870 [Cutaneotrichosporon cavernicola]
MATIMTSFTSAAYDTDAEAMLRKQASSPISPTTPLPFAPKRRRQPGGGYLPLHKRRRNSLLGVPLNLPRSAQGRRRAAFLLFLILLIIWALYYVFTTYEFQFEMSVYSRKWVSAEFDGILPLKGCFDNASPSYNVTRETSHMLSPGISLRRGMTCYDFASTVQPPSKAENLLYHTYWRTDLRDFGVRQAATIEAFLASQPHASSRLILWSNGAKSLRQSPYVRPFLDAWGHVFEVRQADLMELAVDTELDGLLGSVYDARGWVDGDALRLLLLYHYGGIWMDMDMLLTRDLHTLAETEFVGQWDCYDKPYFQMNGAVMHFRKHSPYLCEAFHIMATSPFPRPASFGWGSHLYAKLHRALIAGGVRPFAVLPWCFTDPRNCRTDIRFPDPFEADPSMWGGREWEGESPNGREILESKMRNVFAIHLHNQWDKDLAEGGYIERLLVKCRERIEGIVRQANRE